MIWNENKNIIKKKGIIGQWMKLIYRTTGRLGFRFIGKLSMYKCNIVIMKYDFHVKEISC